MFTMPKPDPDDLQSLRNIGPAMAQSLRKAGIKSASDLRELGGRSDLYRAVTLRGITPFYHVLRSAHGTSRSRLERLQRG